MLDFRSFLTWFIYFFLILKWCAICWQTTHQGFGQCTPSTAPHLRHHRSSVPAVPLVMPANCPRHPMMSLEGPGDEEIFCHRANWALLTLMSAAHLPVQVSWGICECFYPCVGLCAVLVYFESIQMSIFVWKCPHNKKHDFLYEKIR